MQKCSVAFIPTSIGSLKKKMTIAKIPIELSTLPEPSPILIQYEKYSDDAASFIHQPSYLAHIPVSITSNALLTVACSLDTGAGSNTVR